MRLLVLGATGKIGTHLLDLGLSAGHRLTAFVRSPDKIQRTHASLDVVRGDPKDTNALAAALVGHDAVLSCLGPRSSEVFRASTLMTDCAHSVVRAMTAAGVHRVVVTSAAPLFPESAISLTIARLFLRHHFRDLRAMEPTLTASHLEWTIARAPGLFQSDDASYRAMRDGLPKGAFTMSYRGVAAFMLDTVERGDHVRAIVGLARGDARAKVAS